MGSEQIVLKINQRDITPKVSKGEQPFNVSESVGMKHSCISFIGSNENCKSYPETNVLKNLSKAYGFTICQDSAQTDINCRRSYPEMKKFTD